MTDVFSDRRRGAAALAVVSVCLGLFFVYGIEWVENEVDLGYGEEARREGYLAAALFLRAQGVEGETLSGLSLLDALPGVDDTIVLASSRRTLSERRLAALQEWVEAGGQLIVQADEVFDPDERASRDAFLDGLGIFLNDPQDLVWEEDAELDAAAGGEDRESGELGEADEIDEIEGVQPEDTLGSLLERAFSGELPECQTNEDRLAYMIVGEVPRKLQLELSSDFFLSTADGLGLEAAGSAGAQLVRVPVGSGLITVATSSDIWTNRRIHCHDHAYLLWFLTRDSAAVWLLHDPEAPRLEALMLSAFPLTFAGCLLLLLIWGAARSLRFGPRRRVKVGERRQLLEHLQATADFGWRSALLDAPLEALRQDLVQRAARDLGVSPLSAGQHVKGIAKLARIPERDVEFAFNADPLLKKRDFVRTMGILARIRRRL